MAQSDLRSRPGPKMASATGMPASVGASEGSPLLGQAGAVKQADRPLPVNFVSGWGIVSFTSVIALTVYIIVNVAQVEQFILFLYHPIFQSLGVMFVTLAILVLQPTRTSAQKTKGQKAHAAMMLLAMLSLTTGTVIIEYNKIRSDGPHFHSPHGVLGVVAAAAFLFQYVGGFTMLNTPKVYGGDAKAKAVWKYHRRSGYVLFVLMLGTVVASAGTDYVRANLFEVPVPAVLAVLVAGGVIPRISREKLGF